MWTINTNRRKLGLALGVGAAVIGLTLSGCASSDAGSGGGAGKSDSALQKIIDRGQINIGACLTSPPYGLIKSNGDPDGFDVTLAKKIAKDLDVKLNIIDTNNASRIPELQTGKADAVICTFTITPERQKEIDFTDPYVVTGRSLVVKKGSDIKSVDDLTGRTVASTKGGISVQIINDANPKAVQQPYDNYAQELLALQQGQAEAMIEESNLVTQAAKKDPNLKIVVDGEVGEKSNFGVGVKKDQPELLDRLNEIVADFGTSGAAKKAFVKYFEFEPTFQLEGLSK